MRGAAHQRVEVAVSILAYLDSMLNTTFIRDISTQRASASKLSTISRITLALSKRRNTLCYQCGLAVKGFFQCVLIHKGRIRPDSSLLRPIVGNLTGYDFLLNGRGSIAVDPQHPSYIADQCFKIFELH